LRHVTLKEEPSYEPFLFLRSLSRPLVEYRVILSFGLSAACGVMPDSLYPLQAQNPFLQLVALERPAIFHLLIWSYSIFLYSTPFLVLSILFSLAYIHLYEPKSDRLAGALPPYPDPMRRAELFLVAGEVQRQLKQGPSPDPRWLVIPEGALYTGVCVIVLADAIPESDRILAIEDTADLSIRNPNPASVLPSPAHIEDTA